MKICGIQLRISVFLWVKRVIFVKTEELRGIMEANKMLVISDRQYVEWIKELKRRFLGLRLKATVEVNKALLAFNWSVGKDIADSPSLTGRRM